MVQFDNQYRQVKVKIVYYGPALGGKTTCLQHIHRATDPQQRTRLYSLNTASDRTLFFDLLSLNLGQIRGYRLAVQLYTVPGQVQYNATRRTVLAGADGVVFVADSQFDQRDANIESMANLADNLKANGLDPKTLPIVLLYNKRDLEHLQSVSSLDADLNQRSAPSFPATAISGEGVMEAFAAIAESTLVAVADKLGVGDGGQAVDRLTQQVRLALRPFVSSAAFSPAVNDVEVTVPEGSPVDPGPLSEQALISEAVRANLSMTDLSARSDTLSRQLERKSRVTAAITDFGRAVTQEHDPANVLRMLVKTAVTQLKVQAATALIVPVADQLREAVVHGLDNDPLLAVIDGDTTLAGTIARTREPVLVARDLEGRPGGVLQRGVDGAGFASAIAVPLVAQDRLLGMLTLYGGRDRQSLDEDDLELATILGATAAMGYANALAFRQLEEVNLGLESTVEQRTDELRATVDEVQRLNDALRRMDAVKNQSITKMAEKLRSPVTSLVTATRALDQCRETQPAKASRLIDIIRLEAGKLSETIESVVQAAHLGAGSDRERTTENPLEELLSEAISPCRDLARKYDVALKVLKPSGLETIKGDGKAVGTALRAVIKNALEYNSPGGEVRIEVHRVLRRGHPWIEFRVTDTGQGIAEADLPRVFDPFWQGPPGRAGEHHGVGIGLMIAKQIVEQQSGEVTVESRSSEGTTVSILLPQ